MSKASACRVLFLILALLSPIGLSAAPQAYPGGAQPTSDQIITDLAMDPTGRYVMVAVATDLGLALPGQQSKPDLWRCSLAAPASSATAPTRSCVEASHTKTPDGASPRADQSLSVTSFNEGSALRARWAIAGPGNLIGYWTESQQTAAWEEKLEPGQNVLNATVSPDGKRVIAAVAPASATAGNSFIRVYDALATSGSGVRKWDHELVSTTGESTGVVPGDLEYVRNGRYLAIGLSRATSDADDRGTLILMDPSGNEPTSDRIQKASVSGSILEIATADDGSAIAVGTTKGVVFFPYVSFPTITPAPTPFSSLDSDGAHDVAIARDGSRFAAAFGTRIVFFRNVNGIIEETGRFDTHSRVSGLDYDTTGSLLVAVAGNRVYGFSTQRAEPVWDFDATRAETTSTPVLDAPLADVAISENGDRIVVAGRTKFAAYYTATAADLATEDGVLQHDAAPGTIVRLQLRLTNTGSLADEFRFRVEPPIGWRTPVTPENVALLPGQFVVTNLSVEVPEGKEAGKYDITIAALASSRVNASREDDEVDVIKVRVVVPRTISLMLEPDGGDDRFKFRKGETRVISFAVRNVGNADGVVNFSVDQASSRGASWPVTLSDTRLTIPRGATANLDMIVQVPTDAASGEVNQITLVAQEGDYRATRNLIGLVDPLWGVEVVASNRSLEFTSVAPQQVKITIRNTGNVEDAYNITATVAAGGSNAWQVVVHQKQVTVPRGETKDVGVSINPTSTSAPPSSITVIATSQRSLDRTENSDTISVIAHTPVITPTPVDDGTVIPGPSVALLLLALVGLAAWRRLRGGR